MPRTFRLHQKVERRAVKSTVRRPCHERSQPSAIILLLGERNSAALTGFWLRGYEAPVPSCSRSVAMDPGTVWAQPTPLRLEWPLGPAGRGVIRPRAAGAGPS